MYSLMKLIRYHSKCGTVQHISNNNLDYIFCGFGGFKQLKPTNEQHIGFLNSWIAKYMFNSNLCDM